MRSFSLFLLSLVSCLASALPEAPAITVDNDVLQKFFVGPSVKQPGQFTKVVSITPSLSSRDVSTKTRFAQTKALSMQMAGNYMSSSVINTCRQMISLYRPFSEGPLVEFVVAHVLNAYTRVHKIIDTLDLEILSAFSRLNGAPESEAVRLCESNDVVTVAAIQFTREGDKSSACRQFSSMISKDKTLVLDIIRRSAESRGSLQQVNHLLLEDERSPFASAVTQIRNFPVFPKIFQTLFLRKIVDEFSDYVAFYNQIENSPEVANVIGMPVRDAKNMVVQMFTDFLKNERLL